MIGSTLIGGREQKTDDRFRTVDDFKTQFSAIEIDYDNEDVIFTGWFYKVNTPNFNNVNRYQYGWETNLKKVIVEYTGSSCYIPTSGHCFFLNIFFI